MAAGIEMEPWSWMRLLREGKEQGFAKQKKRFFGPHRKTIEKFGSREAAIAFRLTAERVAKKRRALRSKKAQAKRHKGLIKLMADNPWKFESLDAALPGGRGIKIERLRDTEPNPREALIRLEETA